MRTHLLAQSLNEFLPRDRQCQWSKVGGGFTPGGDNFVHSDKRTLTLRHQSFVEVQGTRFDAVPLLILVSFSNCHPSILGYK
jgi:hypothetical protein